jgi:hypothetical protein
MKLVEWSMEGAEFMNCNCAYGCPCQFQGNPTYGNCVAYWLIQIERGRFGEVPLDGLRWGILAAWPGAIHEGNGMLQTIIDERANPKQRAAIEAVSHGKETEPGKVIWQIFSTTVTKFLPTLYKPIDLMIDLTTRKAQVKVPGVVEGRGTSIKNDSSGTDVPTTIIMPVGFEFQQAEFISGTGKTANGEVHFNFDRTHAHLARVHWTTHGVVR